MVLVLRSLLKKKVIGWCVQTFGGSKLSGDPNFRGIQTFGESKLSGDPNGIITVNK